MPVPVPEHETRSLEQLRAQYEVEKELARRLLEAPAERRQRLYSEVYEELLRRVPHLPQLAHKKDPESEAGLVRLQTHLLSPFLGESVTFLEVGSGSSALALSLANRVNRVLVVEASETITAGLATPDNFELVIASSPPYDLPPSSVDLAFSCHFIEHLHPDDALSHAREMFRLVKPGGGYVCVTPNRLHGPHDVAKYFSDRTEGLHLREYTHQELGGLFRRAGFSRVRVLQGIDRAPDIRSPLSTSIQEAFLGILPLALRRQALAFLARQRSDPPPFRHLEQVMLWASR